MTLSGVRLLGLLDLCRFRVSDILLVSSLYDSFTLTEEGLVGERMATEFLDLNLRPPPSVTRVATGIEALAAVRTDSRFNLVITSPQVGDMRAATLAECVRQVRPDIAIVAIAYDVPEAAALAAAQTALDQVFLWQGDVRLLPAIVRLVEDRVNVTHDSGDMGVQLVIVVEDSVRFYSSFLPVIYTELMTHAAHLVPEGLNLAHKLMRLQARPKIVLCSTFEEACVYFERFEENTLGVISDIEFPKEGVLCGDAGAELARRVRTRRPDVPVMLQSSRPDSRALAESVGASFLLKDSPTLLHDLRRFIVDHFGFGDFVFRRPDGTEVARASDLRALEALLTEVPADSIAYHAERNHFSTWFKARTEYELAHELRPRRVSDFPSLEALRTDLIHSIHEYRRRRSIRLVADFDRTAFDGTATLSRLGGGSLGGKARGLAFVNHLLAEHSLRERFPGVRITVPPAVVLGTDVFDAFLEHNHLNDIALRLEDDAEIQRRFRSADLPPGIVADLVRLIDFVRRPLAVRSSSLLEDSQYQPFAGIYETRMVANCATSDAHRLAELIDAIKRVYASTFGQRARAYVKGISYRLEEERMAVMLQKLAGRRYGRRFYPHVSGIARSRNVYPVGPARAEDGIAAVALGFGETVASGRPCLRFSPRHPRHLVQFSSVHEFLENSQREFFALTLDQSGEWTAASGLSLFDLAAAHEDGTLTAVASSYSPENDMVYDGAFRPGIPLVTFAPMLKHGLLPLAEIVSALLDVTREGVDGPVEIEFAASLSVDPHVPHEFNVLQLRPLSTTHESVAVDIADVEASDALCTSDRVAGSGRLTAHDLVVVDAARFDRARSREVARDVARFNNRLSAADIPFILVGVGRWGSGDPFLGIPVCWEDINGARVIVEAGFRDILVSPSQGTHFFQNLVGSGVIYFTVNAQAGEGTLDWGWLRERPAMDETAFVRHIRLEAPVLVAADGRTHRGVIFKPVH
ncbi:MAG TPA: PEP/pyruvate-binding domain-containing protein [Vicinamibacterales bacterium]|nr:PEP/pyruvate-binding domain-containing protein [Vicinamibacterales bacterium]